MDLGVWMDLGGRFTAVCEEEGRQKWGKGAKENKYREAERKEKEGGRIRGSGKNKGGGNCPTASVIATIQLSAYLKHWKTDTASFDRPVCGCVA